MLPKPNSLVSTFDIKIYSPLLFYSISSTFGIMNSCDGHSDSLLYKNSAPYLQTFSLNNFKDLPRVPISAGFPFIFTYRHTSLPTFFRTFPPALAAKLSATYYLTLPTTKLLVNRSNSKSFQSLPHF